MTPHPSHIVTEEMRNWAYRWLLLDSGFNCSSPAVVQHLAQEVTQHVAAEREACAKLADPGPQPCDCINQLKSADGKSLYWSVGCYCGNHGDLGEAYTWRERRQLCDAIRAQASTGEK